MSNMDKIIQAILEDINNSQDKTTRVDEWIQQLDLLISYLADANASPGSG